MISRHHEIKANAPTIHPVLPSKIFLELGRKNMTARVNAAGVGMWRKDQRETEKRTTEVNGIESVEAGRDQRIATHKDLWSARNGKKRKESRTPSLLSLLQAKLEREA